MSECLHCDINELVEKHVEQNGDKVDVTDIAAKMAESLADLILFSVPENEQPRLIAHTLSHFGHYLLEKSGAVEGDTTH